MVSLILNISSGGIYIPDDPLGDVFPERGSLYLVTPVNDLDEIYTYIYKIDLKNYYQPDREHVFDFEIHDNESDVWVTISRFVDPGKSPTLKLAVNFAKVFTQPVLGEVEYRIVDVTDPNDPNNPNVVVQSHGPDIKVNFRNEKFTEKGKNMFDYSVDVLASKDIIKPEGLPIYIYYKNENGTYERYNEPKYYFSLKEEWETIKWENAPRFSSLEFAVDPNVFMPKSN